MLRSATLTEPLPQAAPAPGPRSRELDAETIARCKEGDERAFVRFVEHYERPVMALLSRVLGSDCQVEDLAQDVFLRAFRALPAFDLGGSATVTTWLLTIATHLALNDKRRPRRNVASLSDGDAVDFITPERARSRVELGRAIERAADALPIDQRAAFVLAELHELPMADIAVALGIPESTAKTRLFRAREKMRALLEHDWREA